MRNTALTLALTLALPAICMGFDETVEVDRAQQATAEYAQALKAELMAAMKSGGALQAIEVCNTQARVIGEEISLSNGFQLSRVSLRNRNPSNVPNEWQTAVLNEFENRQKAGEPADSLNWHAVAETDNGREFRFMKAIPTGAPCLQCHGPDIAPAVADRLSALYPEDRATGFSLGELRGAFVATRRLD